MVAQLRQRPFHDDPAQPDQISQRHRDLRHLAEPPDRVARQQHALLRRQPHRSRIAQRADRHPHRPARPVVGPVRPTPAQCLDTAQHLRPVPRGHPVPDPDPLDLPRPVGRRDQGARREARHRGGAGRKGIVGEQAAVRHGNPVGRGGGGAGRGHPRPSEPRGGTEGPARTASRRSRVGRPPPVLAGRSGFRSVRTVRAPPPSRPSAGRPGCGTRRARRTRGPKPGHRSRRGLRHLMAQHRQDRRDQAADGLHEAPPEYGAGHHHPTAGQEPVGLSPDQAARDDPAPTPDR